MTIPAKINTDSLYHFTKLWRVEGSEETHMMTVKTPLWNTYSFYAFAWFRLTTSHCLVLLAVLHWSYWGFLVVRGRRSIQWLIRTKKTKNKKQKIPPRLQNPEINLSKNIIHQSLSLLSPFWRRRFPLGGTGISCFADALLLALLLNQSRKMENRVNLGKCDTQMTRQQKFIQIGVKCMNQDNTPKKCNFY